MTTPSATDKPLERPLVAYLDGLDQRLLGYVDAQGDLRADTAGHLHRYAVALLMGAATPRWVLENWKDCFDLFAGFVHAYGTPLLKSFSRGARFLDWVRWGVDEPLTTDDRVFLMVLADRVRRYVDRTP